MREIKFRAWDFNTHEMITVDDIQFYNPEEVEIDGGIFLKPKPVQPIMINTKSAWRVADGEDAVLMQFTGLHDKNGKEIYEGDILRVVEIDYESVDEKSGKFGKKLVDEIAVVEWKSIGWGFRIKNNMWLYDGYRNFEVIGNIYQNPELLANKQKS